MRILMSLLDGLVPLILWAVAVLVVLSLFNRLHGAIDTVAQFRLHLLALLGVAVLAALFLGHWQSAAAGSVVAVVAIVATAPSVPGFGPGHAAASAPSIRVVTFNKLHDNTQTNLAAKVILAARPDIVVMQEVKGTPNALMERLASDLPNQLRCADGRVGGTAVISRLPLSGDAAKLCSDTPHLSAFTARVGEDEVTFASYHGDWPWPWGQRERIEALVPALESLPHPLVIGGDFNATPWTEGVREVARRSRTSVAAGLRPSWLTLRLPDALRPLIGLPLDHVLVSDGIVVTGARRLPYAGSDHLPVLFEIKLR